MTKHKFLGVRQHTLPFRSVPFFLFFIFFYEHHSKVSSLYTLKKTIIMGDGAYELAHRQHRDRRHFWEH